MKRMLALLLVLCLLVTALAACNPSDQNKPNPASDFEYKIDGDQVTITKYIGSDQTVLIPEVIEGKLVTTIGREAFLSSTITECTLPSTIRVLEDYAFALCNNMEKITLNEGLITICDGAFLSEAKLKELTIPSTVTNVTEDAFITGQNQTSALEKIIFEGNAPNNYLKPIPWDFDTNYTIYYHENAQGFTFPRWNGFPTQIIENERPVPLFEDFEYKENADGGITILAYDGSAETVTVPAVIESKNVTKIEMFAFKNNDTLVSVTLPNTVTSIERGAFFSCSALTTANLSNTLTSIGSYAFFLSGALANLSLPATLTRLGDGAFQYCQSLKSVTVPAGLTEWGQFAFTSSGLESVVLEEGLTEIGEFAFSNTQLQSAALPSSIRTLKANAFSSCGKLETITLNEGLKTIEAEVFAWSGLKSVALPSTVTTLGEHAFEFCRSLETVSLNEGLQSIGDFAFDSAKSLTEILIPSTVTDMDESVFNNCTELTAVKFEGNAPEAYENAEAGVVHGSGYGVYYTVYYHEGATGFTPDDWCGYQTAFW